MKHKNQLMQKLDLLYKVVTAANTKEGKYRLTVVTYKEDSLYRKAGGSLEIESKEVYFFDDEEVALGMLVLTHSARREPKLEVLNRDKLARGKVVYRILNRDEREKAKQIRKAIEEIQERYDNAEED